MENNKTYGRLLRRFAAASAGIVMAFGCMTSPALSVTTQSGGIIAAFAEQQRIDSDGWTVGEFRSDGHVFKYAFKQLENTDISNGSSEAFILTGVKTGNRTLKIPATVRIGGVTHTVNALASEFGRDISAENVIIPDTVTDIGKNVFHSAAIGSITVPGSVKYIGCNFCRNVRELIPSRVKFDASSLENIMFGAFAQTPLDKPDSNGAVIAGDCLLRYTGSCSYLDIKSLSRSPITCIAGCCFENSGNKAQVSPVTFINLSGVKTISAEAFSKCDDLACLSGTEDLLHVDLETIKSSSWYKKYHANDDKVIIGDCVIRYKAGETLDLTADEFKNVTKADIHAFIDLSNVKTLKLRNDEPLLNKDFVKNDYALKNLEEVYIGGSKVECTSYDDYMPDLIRMYYKPVFQRSQFCRHFTDNKLKLVFDQLGIEYYGPYNNKVGTLSAEDEFYITKLLHDYISRVYHRRDGGADTTFEMINIGSDAVCQPYAEMYAYMLQCAGVNAEAVGSQEIIPAEELAPVENNKPAGAIGIYDYEYKGKKYSWINWHSHLWTLVNIGGDWYHIDISWDSLSCDQGNNNNYDNFLFTDEYMKAKNKKNNVTRENGDLHSIWSFHNFDNTDPYYFYQDYDFTNNSKSNAPFYGDTNGDLVRDEKDYKIIQGFLLLSPALQQKIRNGNSLTESEMQEIANIRIPSDKAGSTAADDTCLVDANGDLNIVACELDANFDGAVDFSDVLTMRQICSGKCADPITGSMENHDIPPLDYSNIPKQKMSDPDNKETYRYLY